MSKGRRVGWIGLRRERLLQTIIEEEVKGQNHRGKPRKERMKHIIVDVRCQSILLWNEKLTENTKAWRAVTVSSQYTDCKTNKTHLYALFFIKLCFFSGYFHLTLYNRRPEIYGRKRHEA